MIRIILLTIVIFSSSAFVEAAVVFSFSGAQGDTLDGSVSGMVTVGGITATVSTNSGVLNKGTSFFGIDSIGTDETTKIDDDNVDELLTISFSEDVFLNSFVTSSGNSATEGAYTAGLGSGTFNQVSGGAAVTTTFGGQGQLITTAQNFTVQQNSGASGFSFDSISVTSATAVPEPSSVLLIAGVGLVGGVCTRRRRWRVTGATA